MNAMSNLDKIWRKFLVEFAELWSFVKFHKAESWRVFGFYRDFFSIRHPLR